MYDKVKETNCRGNTYFMVFCCMRALHPGVRMIIFRISLHCRRANKKSCGTGCSAALKLK